MTKKQFKKNMNLIYKFIKKRLIIIGFKMYNNKIFLMKKSYNLLRPKDNYRICKRILQNKKIKK